MDALEPIDTHGLNTARAKQYFAEFIEDSTVEFIEDTFEYDADDLGEASDVLLAAELVAALLGAPAADLPEDVRAALKGKPAPNKKLLTKTRAAVRAILAEQSALRAYWAERGGDASWLGAVKGLLDRIT